MSHEEDILTAIFNPDFPLGLSHAGGAAVRPTATPTSATSAPLSAQPPLSDEEKALRAKETEGAKKAEQGHLEDALKIFTEVIEADPQRASGYNNRAQVLQFLSRPDEALADLDKALSCANLPDHVARMAYFQRAMVKRIKGDDEGARLDFEGAARLGDEVARREAAKLNPYAAMCNQMLASVMSTMKQSQQQQQQQQQSGESDAASCNGGMTSEPKDSSCGCSS